MCVGSGKALLGALTPGAKGMESTRAALSPDSGGSGYGVNSCCPLMAPHLDRDRPQEMIHLCPPGKERKKWAH